ncbi:MAG TPA: triple tyrosine motif-containing protein, partial [Burkholderiales bacterium]|nr:triple tyrosine motif-containing protein [Burkholderiales bacterium]
GDYWITASLGGMARFRSGRWERMFGPAGGAFVPKSMLADARGRLFVHWNERTLSMLDGRAQTVLPIPFGGYQPDDVVLHSAAPHTLFVAGRFGLARLWDGRFQTLYAPQAPQLSDVKGMVRTPTGEMWFAGPAGIVRMTADQLEGAFADPSQPLSMQLFGAADGLRSRPHSHSRNAIVQGGDGRLWIATQTGTLWLDPANTSHSRTPPRVAVSALSADRVYRDPSSIKLPAGTSNIQIDFAVLAFSNPRSARVRYRIEGQDPDWIEAGTRRQAFYTNLSPGTYRFQVMAANGDGVWNVEGATVAFEVLPTFFQSRWFLALCILLALVPLWLLYRLRVAQVARRIAHDFNLRLDERVNERTRIARELHDTLLQSFQGLMLRFQSARDLLPGQPAKAVEALDGALDRADQAIAEGRDAIQNLRSSTVVSNELAQAITTLAEELENGNGEKGSVMFKMSVEGSPRDLHPIVRDDIHRIAREALRNAFHHAQADRIEAEVTYGARELRVRIRDDGKGIDPQHLSEGRVRHWGLAGMRERAVQIGAQLNLWSEVGAGTEVELRVPGAVAYTAPGGRAGVFRMSRKEGSPS